MPGVEFNADDTTEDLPEPTRRPLARVTVAAVTLAAAAIAIGVAVTHDHRSGPHLVVEPGPSSVPPTRTPSTVLPPSPSSVTLPVQPVVAASAVLNYTGVFTESGSLGSADLTYDFVIANVSTKDVQVSYPITLAGPTPTAVPIVFAGFYDEADAQKHINDSKPPAHRLTTLHPIQPVSLLIRVHVNCRNLGSAGAATNNQPVIQVRIAGFPAPAQLAFSQVANGFDDAVRQMCGV
jgi:hypothetical protein